MVLLPLAAIIAVLVGHPIPTTCEQLPSGVLGQTVFVNGTPTEIRLSLTTCWEWDALAQDPNVERVESLAGGALAVAIHEAEHARYDSTDEAVTECRTLRDYGLALDLALGRSRTAGVDYRRLWMIYGAGWLDGLAPAVYHGATC